VVKVAVPGREFVSLEAVTVVPDGGFAAVATVGCGYSCTDVAAFRFDEDGSPDSGFGTGGLKLMNLGGGDPSVDPGSMSYHDDSDRGVDVSTYPGGRLVVLARSALDGQGVDSVVVRLGADGSRDPSFGRNGVSRKSPAVRFRRTRKNGKWIYSLWPQTRPPRAMLVGRDGSIFIAGGLEVPKGYSGNKTGLRRGAVIKLRRNGSFDEGFGPRRGWISFDRTSITGLARDRCGRILVSGRTFAGPGLDDFGLFRFRADGRPDRRFGIGVKRIRMGGERKSRATSLSVSGSRVVIAGTVTMPWRGEEFGAVSLQLGGNLSRCR
jgi:uncharacterized delta-60 repeat protein